MLAAFIEAALRSPHPCIGGLGGPSHLSRLQCRLATPCMDRRPRLLVRHALCVSIHLALASPLVRHDSRSGTAQSFAVGSCAGVVAAIARIGSVEQLRANASSPQHHLLSKNRSSSAQWVRRSNSRTHGRFYCFPAGRPCTRIQGRRPANPFSREDLACEYRHSRLSPHGCCVARSPSQWPRVRPTSLALLHPRLTANRRGLWLGSQPSIQS